MKKYFPCCIALKEKEKLTTPPAIGCSTTEYFFQLLTYFISVCSF